MRVLTSRSLARKVIEELERLPGPGKQQAGAQAGLAAASTAGRQRKDADPEAQMAGAVSGFLGGLGVSNIKDTRLLEVTYVSPDPKMAAHSVNTLFDKFIEFNLEMKAESTKQAAEFLTAQIEEMRRSLAQKEQELQEYGKRKELYYIRGEDSTVVQKLSDLNGAYTAAQIERINREAIYRELKGKPFDNYSDVRASTLIQGLKQEYSDPRIGDQEKVADLPGLLPRDAAPALPAGRAAEAHRRARPPTSPARRSTRPRPSTRRR